MRRIESPRDIVIMRDGGRYLVTAVDSCGGIGEAAGDALACPPETVGLHTARVALLEVMAAGAVPVMATVAACNAPEYAERLLAGVRQAFSAAGGLDMAVSTEKNMAACMTGLGVSVTGACGGATLRVGRSRPGDLICLAGMPLVGPEVLACGEKLFKPEHMADLLGDGMVGSILPVGSRGIAAEADVLAGESGLSAVLDDACGIDFQKSAGPSSCVIFSARPPYRDAKAPFDAYVIGKLMKR